MIFLTLESLGPDQHEAGLAALDLFFTNFQEDIVDLIQVRLPLQTDTGEEKRP